MFPPQEHLIKFLDQSPFPHARELLVMVYLQRGSYVEAIRLNEQLKQDTMVGLLYTWLLIMRSATNQIAGIGHVYELSPPFAEWTRSCCPAESCGEKRHRRQIFWSSAESAARADNAQGYVTESEGN